MSNHSDGRVTRAVVSATLFAWCFASSPAVLGYTVIGNPPGCIGSCSDGGSGFIGDDNQGGAPDQGGGNGGGGSSVEIGSSADNPIEVPIRAPGTCHDRYTRELRADQAVRAFASAEGVCHSNGGADKYYWITFEDGWGGVFYWSGSCIGSTFMTEQSFPTCR